MGISDVTQKMIGDKKRWREFKARTHALPENYRTAVDGFTRYLMYFGAADGDTATSILEDLIDVFERAAAAATPIRDIVGDDPVEFADALIANYEKGGYIAKERNRLNEAVSRAEAMTPQG